MCVRGREGGSLSKRRCAGPEEESDLREEGREVGEKEIRNLGDAGERTAGGNRRAEKEGRKDEALNA